MVVRQVSSGHISTASRERASCDTSGALGQVELTNHLSRLCGPHVNSRGRARLSSHNSLSVCADVDRQDVVSMVRLLRVLVLGSHSSLLATVELLLASIGIHNNTESSNHVDSLAF